jgi:hypothetical protein
MSEDLSIWARYKKNLGDTRPWDLVNTETEWASEELSTNRYEICQSCPELIKLTKQCKKCGCFMVAKTKLQKASCPIGKW